MKPIYLLDMDGPIVDFEGHFLSLWRRHYPTHAFIPLSRRGNFWVQEQYAKLDPSYPKLINKIVGTTEFFRTAPAVDGARKAVREMRECGAEVFFCSSPRPGLPQTALGKLEWVDRNFGEYFANRTILTQDKTVIFGHVLIDDKPDISGANPNPSWRQVLWDMPFNRSCNGMPRMRRWASWRSFLGVSRIAR
mgnify:CR=1 FL=1